MERKGTIAREPDKKLYNINEEVQLTTTHESGWSFNHWSRYYIGSDNPVTITMDSNNTIIAHFVFYLDDLDSGLISTTKVTAVAGFVWLLIDLFFKHLEKFIYLIK